MNAGTTRFRKRISTRDRRAKILPNRAMLPEHHREFGELERKMLQASSQQDAFLIANKIICRGLELEAQGFIVPVKYAIAAYYNKEIIYNCLLDLVP